MNERSFVNQSAGFQNAMHRSFCSKPAWSVRENNSDLPAISKDSLTVWNLRLGHLMNSWRKSMSLQEGLPTRLRHDFVIGPQRHSDLFERPARLYFCVRCKSSFLVCGRKVAVLDEDEVPLTGEESLLRFNTFGEGPCPVLEAFVSAATARAEALRPPSRSKRDQPGSMTPVTPIHTPAWAPRPRPSLRLLTRMRANFST
jgi:hypothetical protein